MGAMDVLIESHGGNNEDAGKMVIVQISSFFFLTGVLPKINKIVICIFNTYHIKLNFLW
jgi:hypothetical protein